MSKQAQESVDLSLQSVEFCPSTLLIKTRQAKQDVITNQRKVYASLLLQELLTRSWGCIIGYSDIHSVWWTSNGEVDDNIIKSTQIHVCSVMCTVSFTFSIPWAATNNVAHRTTDCTTKVASSGANGKNSDVQCQTSRGIHEASTWSC